MKIERSLMKPFNRFMVAYVFCILFPAKWPPFILVQAHSSESLTPASSCVAAEYRQFDFWVGDWDMFEGTSTTPVARAHVDLILDGCVLHEDYQNNAG